MPKTKFQEIMFALLMSLAMAFGMEHYNLGIGHGGFAMWMFKAAWHWKDIPLMTAIVFIMEHFIAGPIARKRAFKLVTPGKDNPLLVTVTIAGCTVLLMCPIMSFWAAVIFKYNGIKTLLAVYLQTLVCNFPMALLWQIFFAGPFVRWLFRTIFKKQLAENYKSCEQGMAA
ncbi:DUF2798 domain-containing protein [Oscillibacter sp.]|uniref:DUF2798 domain-containing protein n=1 Tax=Oscillibacter sp. TaxID=1945593 RepID=UPI00339567E7